MAQRIAGADVEQDLHGSGKHGFRSEGVGEAATVVTPDWLNALQEEVCRAVEGYGAVDTSALDQLLALFRLTSVEGALLNHEAKTAAGGGAPFFEGGAVSDSGVVLLVGISGVLETSSNAGESWTARTPGSSYNDDFRGACFGGSLLVAVGDTGEIQTAPSSAGTPWTRRATGGGTNYQAVAFGNSKFVAVGSGGGTANASSAGTSWSAVPAAGSYAGQFNDIAFGGGVFVAVGESGEIQTSTDGTSWTERDSDGEINHINSVTYVDGVGFFAEAGVQVLFSADGVTWQHTASIAGGLNLQALANNGRVCVGVGFGGEVRVLAGSKMQQSSRCNRASFAANLRTCIYLPNERCFIFAGDSGAIRRTKVL